MVVTPQTRPVADGGQQMVRLIVAITITISKHEY